MKIISGTRYLVDTNVLIYGYDRLSPYHEKSRELLEELVLKNIDAYVALQNIVEFLNVLTKLYNISFSGVTKYIKEILLDFKLIVPKTTTINVFLDILRKSKRRGTYTFDLFLAATMADNDIFNIITANDKDFARISGITAYNPFTH